MKTFRPGPAARLALRFARLIVALILVFSNVMAVPMAAASTPAAPASAIDTPTPTDAPADTATPTDVPADTATPTDAPTDAPTDVPADTATPTDAPAATPTDAPADTATPTDVPAATPTDAPTATPTDEPTTTPTEAPTATPAGPMSSLIVRLVSGLTLAQQQAVIARDGGVETASIPVLRMHFVDAPSATIDDTIAVYRADSQVVSVELDKTRDAGGTPDDSTYGSQWALPKIGWAQVYGSVNPSGSAKLAILDTGVNAGHPDLSGRVVAGYSAFAGSDPQTDPNGHGTWMAGIAAANTNNGTGIAGVAYSGVKIMPVQVLGADGTGQDSDIIEGVVWATDNGADVILMAFSSPGYSPALQAAIDYAWDHGVVLVAATGNDGSSTANFPAGDRGVIGVSATDENDALASGSNYGQDVFLAAPGVGIAATDRGGDYTSVSGTSASAAIVAGAAALMRADSGASNGVIAGRLARNADPAGTQDQTGNGRLNLARAIADTDTTSVKPAGAAPVGSGGPFVGPYVVAAINTTTTIISSLNPSVYGQSVTFTASVTAGSTPVTVGTMTFRLGGNNCNNGQGTVLASNLALNSSGQATYSTSTLAVSTLTIRACYTGTGGGTGTSDSNTSLTQTVTKATVTPNITANDKVYDGNTTATIASRTLTGVIGSDDVSLTGGTATFANKNVGTGKTVTATGLALTGTAAGNYQLSSTTATTTANITAKALTVTGITANNKVYDGTTTASLNSGGATLVGVVSGDSVTLNSVSASGTFASKTVGTGKIVTITGLTLSGADAGNYTVTQPTATANITARALTISATAANKIYDGTTTANVTLSDNRISDDSLNTSFTSATFANKNVGISKTVSVSGISISGTDAGNYTFNTTASTTADITVRSLTVSASGINKIYDGSTIANVTLSDNRVSGDVFTDSYTSASFANKNVGTGKTVSVSGISISGTDGGNYTLSNTTATTTADITARAITVTAATNTKTYDGTTSAAATPTITSGSLATGDTASFTESYTTKNAGTGKTLTPSGSVSDGNSGNNYNVTFVNDTTGVINARALTITATGVNKAYDGTAAATVTLSDNRVSGDVFTDSFTSASFSDKNVGTGKTVSVSGISISGTDAGNYTFNTTATTAANITARSLTVTATGVNKVYDGTTTASVTLSDDRVSGDDVTTSYASATFANKNVATSKSISVSGISISGGADAGNYTLSNTTASTTANITARPITVTAASDNKIYDRTTSSAATPTITSGTLASGDTASFTQTFDNKNVGTGKTLTPFGSVSDGNSGNNYAITFVNDTTGVITARTLNVSATGVNKEYDGTAAATVTLSDDHLSGDDVSTSYTSATFADNNVGTGKTVSVSGISISGADVGNYTANTSATTSADITPKALTGSITANNKVYDGTTSATIATRTLSGAIGGDDVSLTGGTATFADKNVGTGKTVTATGLSLSGADAGNYTVNSTATTTADITARTLTVSATGQNKAYDGTTAATVALSDDKVSGDDITDSYTSASFADKNVGTGKTVTVNGISISGADAGNYTFNTSATTTADITARALIVTATGHNKVYDGTTNATVTLSDDRQAGDVLTVTYTSASFADKSVGVAKVITVSGISISGTDAGNYTVNSTATATANIIARALTITATGVNKTYDGTTAATVTLSDDKVSGDDITDSYTSASFADKNVGTGKTVSVSGISISGTDAGNYTFNTTASTTANITARTLTVTATGVDKVYDATTNATVTLSDDKVSGDDITDSYTSASFADKNVGTGKTVSVSGISISGTDAGNYTFNTTASTTANITAKALTGSITASNKVYDGNINASASGSLAGVESGDDVAVVVSNAAFDTKNVGDDKPVTADLSLTGADAGNYTVNPTASTTANITPRTLTVTATGQNKVYDGTTDATVNLSDDRVSGDDVTASYTSASFSDKNVGTGKTVSVSGISISGTDAGNYTFNTSAMTTADITARSLTITAHSVNKVYDGTTAATVTLSDDRVSGDVFTASHTAATFTDKNVGVGKTVTVSGISISGTDAGNYIANTSTTTTADITARTLTVTATGQNKTYDGTTSATVTLSDDRVSGDVFTDSYTSASFDDKNVGTSKSVSVSGISISGTDAGNYIFNTTATTSADITARALTVSATGLNKVYDGSTTAAVTLSDNRVAGDVFIDSYTSATFVDKNVGTGKSLSVSGISLTGTDAGNYTFNTTASATADITARALVGSITASDKVYDGTTAALVNGSLAGLVTGDDVTLVASNAAFDNKNVGDDKTVTADLSLSGTDAGNYTVNSTASTTANITARALTVSATGQNKVYDGTTAATVTLSDNRVAGDDVTTASTSATFADKNVGTSKTVSVSGISISGTDAGNYTVNSIASTTADITARALTVSASAANKVYDGSTTAAVTLSDDRVSGDDITDSYTSASFANKNVGTGKTVSVSGISISGVDAGNYTFNTSTTTTADITAKTLTVSATGVNKVYDSTTAATVTLSDDRVSGDVFTDSYTSATFADKNVGTGKSVSVSSISISGTDADNYSFNTTASTTANITARPLVVSATGVNKGYDGTANATVTLSDNRVSGDVFTDSYTSASFADKNVGTSKTVSVSGISISGTDAGNYTVNSTASTTADITARALTVSATGINKVYDGSTAATVTLSDNRVAGDIFSDSYTTATFANKNVGVGKTVTVSGISISGVDGGNYSFNTTASTTANITARSLTVSATGVDKVYDGTTDATVTFSDNRVAGDLFTGSYTNASFADKNVGVGKIISVSGISIAGTDAGNYTLSNTTATATANITARPITVMADAKTKVYGALDPALTYQVTSGNLVMTDSLSGALNRVAGENVGTYPITQGTLTAGSNYDLTYVGANLTITTATLTVTADNKTRQYSDANSAFTITYAGFVNGDGPGSLGGTLNCIAPATPASIPNTYPITCSGLTSTNYAITFVAGALTVTKEDVAIQYTGDAIAPINTNLALRATVLDSAASGYTGSNPESGSSATIGDITKMWIAFDIYSANNCGTGSPLTTSYAQVSDTGAIGDGIGTASSTYTASSENSYCVVARLVAGSSGGTNQWYTAPSAEPAGITFYQNTGQFVTGGGWINDPNGGKGNFGFNARYNKSGNAQGQMVYVYRGLYGGVVADFIIKSNSLTALSFTGTNYPISATLQGKCTIQINRSSDGVQLYSDGGATFKATATDSNQNSGIGSDSFSLTVYDKNAVTYKTVPTATLQGGNVVIHLK